jgi:Icc-related predicted phosphoesterase
MATNTRSTLNKTNIFAPAPPSLFQRFLSSPYLVIAQWLYAHQPPLSPPPVSPESVKVGCISDTHNEQPPVPLGDILIHAGDLTVNGTFSELQAQLSWLNILPHAHKIVIAGNHDLLLDQSYFRQNPRLASSNNNEKKLKELNWGNITYLENESRVLHVRGKNLRVYGSPMTPMYGNWVFQYPVSEDVWRNTVPEITDVLITHGPVKGHLDASPSNLSYLQGCSNLQREIWRVKPRLHVCGHVHAARGVEHADWGWLRWGYDAVCRGEGSVGVMLGMLVAWLWM